MLICSMSLLGFWPHFAYNLAELAAVVQSQKTDAGIKLIEFKIFRDCSYTAKTKKKTCLNHSVYCSLKPKP